MSLAEKLAAQKIIKLTRCSVGRVLATLPEADAHALIDYLADGTYTSSNIALALAANGTPVSLQQVGRHRRGQCECA